MRITARSEYGVLALIDLSCRYGVAWPSDRRSR
jgi:hypothetical protein